MKTKKLAKSIKKLNFHTDRYNRLIEIKSPKVILKYEKKLIKRATLKVIKQAKKIK